VIATTISALFCGLSVSSVESSLAMGHSGSAITGWPSETLPTHRQ
jgi:hypothetical protein